MKSSCINVESSRSYLWGESIADRVDVVARRYGVHESIGVGGEAMAAGGQAVSGAAVSVGQTALVHGGRR